MEFIKVIVNEVQMEVTPHEDEHYDLNDHNVEQVVADNIVNKIQSTEKDGNLYDDKDNDTKRKEPPISIKKNNTIENII